MHRLLGDEFPAFKAVFRDPPVSGLRVNTLKISPAELVRSLPIRLSPVPWCSAGFLIQSEMGPGLTSPGKQPQHAAGLYYVQEPSAMLSAEVLHPMPGENILDLCAAPGGKTTHLVSCMKNEGTLIANETHPSAYGSWRKTLSVGGLAMLRSPRNSCSAG